MQKTHATSPAIPYHHRLHPSLPSLINNTSPISRESHLNGITNFPHKSHLHLSQTPRLQFHSKTRSYPPHSILTKPPANDIILLYKAPVGNILKRPIPYPKFYLALDCCGSFIQHFNIDKSSPQGLEGRQLLLIILEPLLGTGLDYGALTMGVNNFCQSRQYKEDEGRMSENVRRFLDVVTGEWKSNKKKRKLEEENGVVAGGMG